MNFEKQNFGQPDMNLEKPGPIVSMNGNIENFIRERLDTELSPERRAELSKELITVASFFDEANIKPYIAGGTGIDLLNGEWDRDHQDLDIAIMGSERVKFFQAAMDAGFLVTDPDRNALNLETITDSKTHNAFLFRSDDQGVTQFEVMFLNETVGGDVKLTDNTTASRTIYNNGPTVSIEGHEVTIQPPEVILFHKLVDGRRKDFRDAKTVWDSLSEEQHGRLTGFLREANVRFVIGEDEITDVQALFARAEQEDKTKHVKFFTEKVGEFNEVLSSDLMARCKEVYEIYGRTPKRNDFFGEVAEKYQGFVPERRVVIEAMADELYSDNPPDIDGFKKWAKQYVKMDERLKEKALYEYVSEKLWETKLEQQD